jgi:hypothetical protein
MEKSEIITKLSFVAQKPAATCVKSIFVLNATNFHALNNKPLIFITGFFYAHKYL